MCKIIFFLATVFTVFSANAQSKTDSLIQLAESRINAKAYESALVYLDEASALSVDIRTNLLTAKVNALTGNFEEAESQLRDAKAVDPNSVALIYQRAEVSYLKGEEKEAVKILNRAIDELPENGDLYYYRGILYNLSEKYSRSIPDFEEALLYENSIEPYKIHLNKGVAHMRLMEYDNALIESDRAVSMAPGLAIVYQSRCTLNYKMRYFEASIADFAKAMELDPDNPEIIFNLGMAYFRTEVFNEACVYFHRSCKLGNNNACKMVIMECGQN